MPRRQWIEFIPPLISHLSPRTPRPAKHTRDVQLPRSPLQNQHRHRQHPAQTTRHVLRRDLEQQTPQRIRIRRQLAPRDLTLTAIIAQSEEVVPPDIAAEKHGVQRILRQDLGRRGQIAVRSLSVVPVGGNALRDVAPATLSIGGGAEEALHGGEVGGSGGAEGREEFVEEGGGAVEEEAFGAEVEVSIVGEGLLPALRAVAGEVFAIEVPLAGVLHEAEEGGVELVVVTDGGEEEVVAGERDIAFEFLNRVREFSSVHFMGGGDGQRRKPHTLWPSRPSSSPSGSPKTDEVREVASQPMESFPVAMSPSIATPRVARVTARS